MEYLNPITAVVGKELVEPSEEVEEVVAAVVEEEVAVEVEVSAVEAKAVAVAEGVEA